MGNCINIYSIETKSNRHVFLTSTVGVQTLYDSVHSFLYVKSSLSDFLTARAVNCVICSQFESDCVYTVSHYVRFLDSFWKVFPLVI